VKPPTSWLISFDVCHRRRDFTLADLAPLTQAAGIDRTVLVQVLPSVAETAEFLALAEESDLVAGVVGWVDLTDACTQDTLSALRSGPGGGYLAGIRHLVQGEPDPRWLARPDVRPGSQISRAKLVSRRRLATSRRLRRRGMARVTG